MEETLIYPQKIKKKWGESIASTLPYKITVIKIIFQAEMRAHNSSMSPHEEIKVSAKVDIKNSNIFLVSFVFISDFKNWHKLVIIKMFITI